MVFGRYDYAAFSMFIAYACCSVVIPVVLLDISRSLHFPLEEGGMGAGGALQLGRSIPMVFSMVACGFMAGRWGKARSLGVSCLLMGLGLIGAAFAPLYGILFLAVAVAGLGEGVVEGLGTPIIQDVHEDDEPGRYISFTHSFWSIGVVAMVTFSGLLLYWGVSWRVVVGFAGLAAMVPTLLFLWPYRGPQRPDKHKSLHWSTVLGHAGSLFRNRTFWLFFLAMVLAGGGEFGLTFWVANFIRLEFNGGGLAGGIGTACFAGGMIVGRIAPGLLVRQGNLKELIIGAAIMGVVLGIFPPFLQSLWVLFPLLFFLGIASGPYWPCIQSYCVDRLPKEDSTMVYILLSCAGIPGAGFFSWLIGWAGDQWGLRNSFFLVPASYLLMGALIVYLARKGKR